MNKVLDYDTVAGIVGEKLMEDGWRLCLRGGSFAQKSFQTAVGEKVAHVYLYPGDEYNRVIKGQYESQGHNILEPLGQLIPVDASVNECIALVAEFAANADAAILDSYAMRLARPAAHERPQV